MRAYEIRAQTVHAHTRPFEFAVERFGETDDGMFRRGVHAQDRARYVTGFRGGVNDVALARRLHDRPEGHHAVGHAKHVHVHDPAPIFRRRIEHRTGRSHPRIVEDHLDPAKMRQRPRREILYGVGIAHVTQHAEHLAAFARKPRALPIEAALFHVGEHDLHAFFQEAFRHPETDSARCPRHDRHAARKIERIHC